MRVLAIDTALGACAAAVLDTAAARSIASESLAMLRGHAEAIMPLIARVMDAAGARIRRSLIASPSPSAPAASPGCGSASPPRAASRLPPASRRSGSTMLAGFAAPHDRGATTDAARRGDRCAQRAGLFPCVRRRTAALSCRRGDRACARRCAPRRSARRASPARRRQLVAAHGRADPPPALVERMRAPDIGWVARLGARRAEGGAAEAALPASRPMRSRRTPPACRADDGVSAAPVRARRAGAVRGAVRATPRRIAALHAASFNRGWSDGESGAAADRPQRGRGPRHDRPQRMCGFILSRRAADEAEILSVAVARAAAEGALRDGCSICICARLAGLGARAVFLEVDEDNVPARGCMRAQVFARSAAATPITADADGKLRPRWSYGATLCKKPPLSRLSHSVLCGCRGELVSTPKLKDIEALSAPPRACG